jgi:hypothetical protein
VAYSRLVLYLASLGFVGELDSHSGGYSKSMMMLTLSLGSGVNKAIFASAFTVVH